MRATDRMRDKTEMKLILEIETGNRNWKSELEIETGKQNPRSKAKIKAKNPMGLTNIIRYHYHLQMIFLRANVWSKSLGTWVGK